ncbi:hypothetical protein Tco_1335575 [Tanacetum coccineum]
MFELIEGVLFQASPGCPSRRKEKDQLNRCGRDIGIISSRPMVALLRVTDVGMWVLFVMSKITAFSGQVLANHVDLKICASISGNNNCVLYPGGELCNSAIVRIISIVVFGVFNKMRKNFRSLHLAACYSLESKNEVLHLCEVNPKQIPVLISFVFFGVTTWENLIEKFVPKFYQLSDNNEEMEVDEDDDPNDIVEIFKIEGNLFDYETPLCKAFNDFNYLLKIDMDLFTFDIQGIKTYEEYELNNNITGDLEEPWLANGADEKLKAEALMHKAKVEESWGDATPRVMKFCGV